MQNTSTADPCASSPESGRGAHVKCPPLTGSPQMTVCLGGLTSHAVPALHRSITGASLQRKWKLLKRIPTGPAALHLCADGCAARSDCPTECNPRRPLASVTLFLLVGGSGFERAHPAGRRRPSQFQCYLAIMPDEGGGEGGFRTHFLLACAAAQRWPHECIKDGQIGPSHTHAHTHPRLVDESAAATIPVASDTSCRRSSHLVVISSPQRASAALGWFI